MARIHRQQPTENENGHAKYSEEKENDKKVNDTTSSTQFVQRVTSFPLVKDSVSAAQAIANKTSLGRFALSKANSTYATVTSFAYNNQPIQTYYQSYAQPLVLRADALGCKSLDVIQEKVPLINQPSSEIYQNVVTKPSYQIIDGVKVRFDHTLTTVTHPAHVVIQETNKRLGVVANNLEGAVDKYLPADDKNVSVTIDKDGNQVIRVYGVLNEASRRLSTKVSQQVSKSTAGIPKSRGDLSKLAENNSVVQTVTAQIRLLQETLVQSVTVYGEAAQKRLPPSINVRIHQTTELLTRVTDAVNQQISHIVGYLKTQPEWVREKFARALQTIYQQLDIVKQELARKDINYTEKIKHVVGNLQTQLLPLLEQVSSQLTTYTEVARKRVKQELQIPLQYINTTTQKVKTQ